MGKLGELMKLTRVAIHVAVGVRSSAVREQVHDLVDRLLVVGEVIPEHGRILQVRLRVPLLGMDEDGELCGIAKEENWGIVEDPVQVALCCHQIHQPHVSPPNPLPIMTYPQCRTLPRILSDREHCPRCPSRLRPSRTAQDTLSSFLPSKRSLRSSSPRCHR